MKKVSRVIFRRRGEPIDYGFVLIVPDMNGALKVHTNVLHSDYRSVDYEQKTANVLEDLSMFEPLTIDQIKGRARRNYRYHHLKLLKLNLSKSYE